MSSEQPYTVEDTSCARLQATPEGLRRFVEARYGLSMHWGLYALNGRGEWVMHLEDIPFDVYRRRMEAFNPSSLSERAASDLMLPPDCQIRRLYRQNARCFSRHLPHRGLDLAIQAERCLLSDRLLGASMPRSGRT